jgi:HSP20 family protein
MAMKVTDLIPWSRKREVPVRREDGGMLALQSDVNRAFENVWRAFDLPSWAGGAMESGMPPVDLRETDKEVEIVAEVPGMDVNDVDVSVASGVLTIRGEKKSERETEEKGYRLRERSFGRIERVVPLPEELNLDAVKAVVKNGVLTVTIPKTPEAQSAVKHIRVLQS